MTFYETSAQALERLAAFKKKKGELKFAWDTAEGVKVRSLQYYIDTAIKQAVEKAYRDHRDHFDSKHQNRIWSGGRAAGKWANILGWAVKYRHINFIEVEQKAWELAKKQYPYLRRATPEDEASFNARILKGLAKE